MWHEGLTRLGTLHFLARCTLAQNDVNVTVDPFPKNARAGSHTHLLDSLVGFVQLRQGLRMEACWHDNPVALQDNAVICHKLVAIGPE